MEYSVQALCEHTIWEEFCDRTWKCHNNRNGVVMIREIDFATGTTCGRPMVKDDPEMWCC